MKDQRQGNIQEHQMQEICMNTRDRKQTGIPETGKYRNTRYKKYSGMSETRNTQEYQRETLYR